MGILLAILSVIGALPGAIQALIKIWEMIKQIRDKKSRLKLRSEHRALVFAAMAKANQNKIRKLSASQHEAMQQEIDDLDTRVQEVLLNQGGS